MSRLGSRFRIVWPAAQDEDEAERQEVLERALAKAVGLDDTERFYEVRDRIERAGGHVLPGPEGRVLTTSVLSQCLAEGRMTLPEVTGGLQRIIALLAAEVGETRVEELLAAWNIPTVLPVPASVEDAETLIDAITAVVETVDSWLGF